MKSLLLTLALLASIPILLVATYLGHQFIGVGVVAAVIIANAIDMAKGKPSPPVCNECGRPYPEADERDVPDDALDDE